jgi:transcriptional regulator with XRE-family HTH domain
MHNKNTNQLNALVGAAIREIRKDVGMTQMQLAEKLGFRTNTYVSNIERGTGGVSIGRLWEFAHALGCYPSDVMMLVEIHARGSTPSPSSSSPVRTPPDR